LITVSQYFYGQNNESVDAQNNETNQLM